MLYKQVHITPKHVNCATYSVTLLAAINSRDIIIDEPPIGTLPAAAQVHTVTQSKKKALK